MSKFIVVVLTIFAFCSGNLLANSTKPNNKNEGNEVKDIIKHVLESNGVFVKRSTSEYFKCKKSQGCLQRG